MNMRICAAGAVLSILAAMSAYGFRRVRSVCADLLAHQTRAEQAMTENAGDLRDALTALTDAWEQSSASLQLWVAGEILCTLNQNISRLIPLCENGSEDLLAELSAVKADVQWLYDQEFVVF